MSLLIDRTGRKYGKLTVIEKRGHIGKNKVVGWWCRCECGKELLVASTNLWTRLSCGCFTAQRIIETHRTHGHASGYKRTAEYRAWKSMKQRCYLKSCKAYHSYGGRGIKVCDRWLESFENFLADVGLKPHPKLTFERRDVNGNYEPSNCYWAPWSVQHRNKTDNTFGEYNGVKLIAKDWSRHLNIPYHTVYRRLGIDRTVKQIAMEFGKLDRLNELVKTLCP